MEVLIGFLIMQLVYLSAAGGKYCGWGKKSTLRVIYLDAGANCCLLCSSSMAYIKSS